MGPSTVRSRASRRKGMAICLFTQLSYMDGMDVMDGISHASLYAPDGTPFSLIVCTCWRRAKNFALHVFLWY